MHRVESVRDTTENNAFSGKKQAKTFNIVNS